MYATCQQLQAQARAHAAAASGLLGHTELRVHMPPSIALATRGRLQGLRLQLALLDREFDDLGIYRAFVVLVLIHCVNFTLLVRYESTAIQKLNLEYPNVCTIFFVELD